VDYANDMVYAAGQDGRIRGWGLSDGEPLPLPPSSATRLTSSSTLSPSSISSNSQLPAPTSSLPHTHSNPFLAQFPHPIPVLRVSADDNDAHSPSFSSVVDPFSDVDMSGDMEGRVWGKRGRDKMVCLWAAGGDDLWRWYLGARGRVL